MKKKNLEFKMSGNLPKAEDKCYTVFKPQSGTLPPGFPIDPQDSCGEGAHYYAYSQPLDLKSVTKVRATVLLPKESQIIWGNGTGDYEKHAFISFGIAALIDNGGTTCDLGLCNFGGDGWTLAIGGLVVGNTTFRSNKIFKTAYKVVLTAQNDTTKDTLTTSYMVVSGVFYDANGEYLGSDTFGRPVEKNDWNHYYRFVSFMHLAQPNPIDDGTKMMGTQFTNLEIYDKNTGYQKWGLFAKNPAYIQTMWIVYYPHGAFSQWDDNSETFNINNIY